MEESSSSNAYSFALSGKVILDRIILFTRHRQQWLLELNNSNKNVILHFIQPYDSIKKKNEYRNFVTILFNKKFVHKIWIELYHNVSFDLDFLI
jgi:hypothetical protein